MKRISILLGLAVFGSLPLANSSSHAQHPQNARGYHPAVANHHFAQHYRMADSNQASGYGYIATGNIRDANTHDSSVIPASGQSASLSQSSCSGSSSCVCDTTSLRSCLPKESWWTHKNTVFGEFLFLVPGDSAIVYATEGTDPAIAGANSPTGPMGILDIGAEPGFRVGGSVALTDLSSAFVTFSWWEGKDEDRITATGLNVLNPHLLHPSTITVAGAGLEATGRQDLGFQLVDAGFRRAFITKCDSVVNWVAGVRYAHLDQAITTAQVASVPTGLTTLRSDVDFHGFGLLAGLDAERRCAPLGISIYGSTLGSLTGGKWSARSRQTNQFGGGVIASDFEEFRIMPIIEAEVGLAWQSSKNRVRAQLGFIASGWLNTISSSEYLDALNRNNFDGLSETLTFSGLTSSLEFRF